MPGLKSPIRCASLLGAAKGVLKVRRQGGATVITLPQAGPPAEPATVVLDVPGKVSAETGRTVLPGHRNDFDPPFATLKNCRAGKHSWMEKFGDWKHADCIVDWQGPGSSAAWTFKTLKAGRYYLDLDYSCAAEADGLEGIVTLGALTLPFPALNTGEQPAGVGFHGFWPLFRTYRCGIVELPKAGRYTLAIRPGVETPKGWIRLRSIALLPVPTVQPVRRR